MPGHVFISYSRADRPYVEKLSSHLSAAGIAVWFDYEIAAGDRFASIIEEKIDTAVALVVVLTPESGKSDWVNREIGYAIDQHKPIVPLMLKPCKMPILLIDRNHEDVTGGRMPSPRLVARLLKDGRPPADPLGINTVSRGLDEQAERAKRADPARLGGRSTRTSSQPRYTSSPTAPPSAGQAGMAAQRARQDGRRNLRTTLIAGAALLAVSGIVIATKIASSPPPPPLTTTTHVYMPTTTSALSNTFSPPAYKSSCAPTKANPHGCPMDMDIYYLKDMHWTTWTQEKAIGIGTAVTQGCVPTGSLSCRITSTLISIPGVKYTFSNPTYICGRYYWSQMIAHYPQNAPADLRAYDHRTRFTLSALSC